MYNKNEILYIVIAREALKQKKCYKCFEELKKHKRCSGCNMLLCNKLESCTSSFCNAHSSVHRNYKKSAVTGIKNRLKNRLEKKLKNNK